MSGLFRTCPVANSRHDPEGDFEISSALITHAEGVGTCFRCMYCVERDNGPDQWARETCFQTEFKAFVHARTRSLATGNTYRVLFSSPSITGEVLRISQGKALLDADDQLVG